MNQFSRRLARKLMTRRTALITGAGAVLCAKAPAQAQVMIAAGLPFGAANLLSWIGTGPSYLSTQSTDTFTYTTLTALADLSGNGNGWQQIYKPWQPTVGSFGGCFFGAGTLLDCVYPLMLTGLSAITMGFTFALSTGGSNNRTLMAISNAAGTADTLSLNFTSGGSPALQAHVNANDSGSTYTTTAGAALSLSTKHTLVCRLDLAGAINSGVGTIDLNVDGASYLGAPATFSLTGAVPWPVAPKELPMSLRIGNAECGYQTIPSPDEALLGEVTGAMFLAEYSSNARVAQLNTWLAAQ